ncbi:hypothetical protein AB0F93_00290 [Micromonospora tulbaghiae]|uniref:hypothetical protein n=1 Tax=Micromonospora tulbaghiae TaxID=479978 RepID=UPI0033259A1A
MTLISSTALLPGQSARVDMKALSDGGATVEVTLIEAEPPKLPPLLIGIEGPNGGETQKQAVGFPDMCGARDFGVKRSGESQPSLTAHGTGKLKDLPATCEPWCSFKHTDIERVKPWLDTMPPVEKSYASYKLTYHHEPHGDAGMTPALYRPRLARLVQIVDGHPNRHRITGVGPIVTGYWIREKKGNPLDWWVPGASVYGVDIYDPPDADHNWSPAEMFDPVLDRLYETLPEDVEICIPEYGRHFVTGQRRADQFVADLEYLASEHPRVTRLNFYCNPVDHPQFYFPATSPEADVARRWMAAAAAARR